MDTKKIVGRKELVSILDLELFDLDAKVDTGADSNALHCDHIEINEKEKFFISCSSDMKMRIFSDESS